MKKTLWVLLLTVCIVFSCLAFTAQADGALQLSVAASGGDYTTIENALADLEIKAKNGELSGAGVKLVLTGTHTATRMTFCLDRKPSFCPTDPSFPSPSPAAR